ncbi:MAG: DUF6151 family protein [Pseudomonadota bacterium]
MDISFSCSCGALTFEVAAVSPKTGTHVHCYCTDCQAFATFLGHGDEVLDELGGTEIFQFVPSRLRVTSGAEHLAVLRFGEKGLMRWYASCCGTPIGNTSATPAVPIMGIVDPSNRALDKEKAIGAMGDSIGAFCPNEGWGPVDAPQVKVPTMILRAVVRAIGPFLAGRLKQHALFDENKRPVAKPRIVGDQEMAAVHQRLDQKRAGSQHAVL